MKSNDKIKLNLVRRQDPGFKREIEWVDGLNADCVFNNNHVYIKTPEEFAYWLTSGKLESTAKSLQGQRMAVILLGEPRYVAEHTPRALCLAQRHKFWIESVTNIAAAWRGAESFFNNEPVSNTDFSNTPQPRLQSIGGAQEKWWTLDGLQGALKLTSLKFIDLYWAEKEHESYPAIIAEEAPRYRYYAVLYMTQGIKEDKAAIESLRTACEQAGAMFRTTTEKTLRVDLHQLGTDMWKRFLADIDSQFKELK